MQDMEFYSDFYIKEFADYMEWDSNQIRDLVFFNGFPCLSNEENDLIKELMKISPNLLDKFSTPRDINVNIHIYCVKGNLVDAFCFKTNDHYYIGIYSEVFKKILKQSKDLSSSIMSNADVASCFNMGNNSLAARLTLCTFQMVLMHEYMHIVLGHCDLVCKSCKFMWEIGNSVEYTEQISLSLSEQRAMEMLADECSSMSEGIKLLQNCNNIEKIKEELLIFYLGTVMFFSLFPTNGVSTATHPCFEFRFNSMAIMIDDVLLRNLNVEDPEGFVEEVDAVIDDLVRIIKISPDILNMDLLSYLVSNAFETEYFTLYNAAFELLKHSNQYARYKLDNLKPLNKSDLDNYELQKHNFYNDIMNKNTSPYNGGNDNG